MYYSHSESVWETLGFNYPGDVKFSFSEVAAALDVDPSDLVAELNLFASGNTSKVNFQAQDPDGNLYPDSEIGYTQGTPGGFWMTSDGTPIQYVWNNPDVAWYNVISWNVLDEANSFFIKVGQQPGRFIDGGECNGHFILSYEDKQVTFDIKLSVKKKADTQFYANFKQKYWTEYLTSNDVNFSFSEVAAALDVDPSDLLSELNLFVSGDTSKVNFQAQDPAGNLFPNSEIGYTQGTPGGFWMTADGTPMVWNGGDPAMSWYNLISWNVSEDADLFTILVGQAPNRFPGGGICGGHFILSYEDKQVTFDITLTICLPVEPTAEMQISKLNIVEEKDLVIKVSEGWKDAMTVSLDVTGIADKLNLDAEYLATNMDAFVFGHAYDDINTDSWLDQLSREYSCTPYPGFWFRRAYDETTGGYDSKCYPSYYKDDSEDFSPFYTSNYTLYKNATQLAVTVGQNTNRCKKDDQFTTEIYIVNYNDAYKLNVIFNVIAKQQFDISDKECAGTTERIVTMYKNYTEGIEVTIPIDSIAELIDVEKSALTFLAYDQDNLLTNIGTAGNGGFWFNTDSRVCAFLESGFSMYVEPVSATDKSKLRVGQWEAFKIQPGESQTCQLILMGEKKYYVLNFTLCINQKPQFDISDKECAGTTERVVKMNKNYTTGIEVTIPIDSIAELIDVEKSALTFLAYDQNDLLTNIGTAGNGGFWFNTDSRVCAVLESGFSMYVEPVSATDKSKLRVGQWEAFKIQPGESQTCQLILMGEKKYYVLNFTLCINQEIEPEYDNWYVVKTFDYSVTLAQNEGYTQTRHIQTDWNAIKEALELEEVDGEAFYTWTEAGQTEWDPHKLTKDYTCGPYPGFWMNETGDANLGWSPVCAYGVSFGPSDGFFTFFVHPESGHVTGQTYEGQFFVVNVLNNKVVQVNTHISYMTSRYAINEIGSSDMTVALNDEMLDAENVYEFPYLLTDVMTQLGIAEEEQEEKYSSCLWYAESQAYGWQAIESFDYTDCHFQKNGYLADIEQGNDEFSLGYDTETLSFAFSLLGKELAPDAVYKTNVALEYEGKAYKFVFTLGSENAVDVKDIRANTDASSSAIYTLDGRRIADKSMLQKNTIYIKDHKKYINK